jgi:asparagine synthase (glutamine-hydrolysing)
MCGIAGQVTADRRPVERQVIAAMGRRLRHRGPDDQGIYVQGHVGLAHQRLSILDLSPAGRQPMSNEAGTVWIVFNGEIYNYRELREQLRTPRNFRSQTDTEVLLYLYEDYGLAAFSMLRGMFALAIWDQPAQRLVLVRDRLGKKPLFYSIRNGTLSFASELKALLVEGKTPEVAPAALHHYLTFQYVPTPLTIFQGIRKLPPGHMLVYEDGKISESAYWSLRYDEKLSGRSDREYEEEFTALLRESVRLRLESDVPLGAFLSGGVDSSSVVAWMSRLSDRPVKTFSIGFKDEAFNELPYAREVAGLFKTDHQEFVVEPSAIDILPTLVRVYDEPFADSSAIPTYYVSQLSRQFVTVVLNGDGGDELLAGYPRYDFLPVDRMAARWLPGGAGGRLRGLLAKSRRLDRLASPFSRTYLNRICYFSPVEKAALYTDDFRLGLQGIDSYDLLAQWFHEAPARDLLDQLLAVDTRSYLPDDLLVKVDRATMAHGLEARSPLLDHKLMEFAASLPVRLKVRQGQGKYLLKQAMRGILPDHLLDRPKQGFGVPIDRWFREDCRDFVRDVLLSKRSFSRGYFQPKKVRSLIDRHQQAAENYGYRLHALLMLELWHREYVDGAGHAS